MVVTTSVVRKAVRTTDVVTTDFFGGFTEWLSPLCGGYNQFMLIYILCQILSIVLLPGVVTGLVPWLILRRRGEFQPGGLVPDPWQG